MLGIVDLSAMIDRRKKEITKEFGNTLKKVRRQRKISLRNLAAMTELEHAHISRIEAGQINPTLTTIVFLANALEVSPRDLLPEK